MDFEYDPETGVEVPGLRGKDVDLLNRAGIVYLNDLADADVSTLRSKLRKEVQHSPSQFGLPDEDELASWIEQARTTTRNLAPLLESELPGPPTRGPIIRRPQNGTDTDGENGDEG